MMICIFSFHSWNADRNPVGGGGLPNKNGRGYYSYLCVVLECYLQFQAMPTEQDLSTSYWVIFSRFLTSTPSFLNAIPLPYQHHHRFVIACWQMESLCGKTILQALLFKCLAVGRQPIQIPSQGWSSRRRMDTWMKVLSENICCGNSSFASPSLVSSVQKKNQLKNKCLILKPQCYCF